MKKLAFLALAAFVLFYCGKGTEKVPVKTTQRVEVRLLPSGTLSFMPERLTLSFSREFPAVKGLSFRPEELKKYIELFPELPLSGTWASSSAFVLRPEAAFKPGKTYTLRIKAVPIKGKILKTTPEEFTFKLPQLKLLGASVVIAGARTRIRLRFNGKISPAQPGKYIEITDEHGNPVNILGYRVKGKELFLSLAVSPPVKLQVKLKRGLPSSLGPLAQSTSFTLPVEKATDYMMVESVKVREVEEGFSISIKLSSPGGNVDLTGIDPTPFLDFSPPINFSAFSSGSFIFINSSDLVPGLSVDLKVLAGLRDKNGFVLKKDYETTLVIPRRKSKLKFIYQGKYLGRNAGLKIPLKAEGIKNLEISLYFIPPTNSLFWYSLYEGEDWGIEDFGEPVTMIKLTPKEGINWLDLTHMVKNPAPGVYFLRASGEGQDGDTLSTSMQLVISDLSLVVKKSKEEIFVWTLDSSSLEPVSGVRVEVRDRKNFLVGSCVSSGAGFCSIKNPSRRRAFFVFAKKGKDWTYLHIPSSTISLTNFDVSGEEPKGDFSVYLYPERELYRPGERVNFALLLRKRGSYKGVSLPVSVVVIDPKGKEFLRLNSKTDASGLATFSFLTVKTSPTGVYRLKAEVGGKQVASRPIHIEEFVPERMRVRTKMPEKLPGKAKIFSEYLFGAPASGQRWEAEILLKETALKCPAHPDYTFGPSPEAQKRYSLSEKQEGILDQKGRGEFPIPSPSGPLSLPLKVKIITSVSEGGSGRVTHGFSSKIYHLRNFYIGLKTRTSRIIEGNPVDVDGIIVSPDCQLVRKSLPLVYAIYRLSYAYTYSSYEDEYGWSSRLIREPVERGRVQVKDGKFSLAFTPSDSYYDYMVEVQEPTTGETTQLIIPGWGWFFTAERPPSPQTLVIRLSKEEGDEGDEIEAQVKLPFEGKILWTLELHGVLKQELREAKGETAKWKFRLPEGVPDVYVSALLIRSSENYLVERAFGVKRIKVKPRRLLLPISLEVPQQIKPGKELKIKVKGKGNFEATIAVVDVGILQITRTAPPDPFMGILKPLSLGVSTAESFGWRIRKFLNSGGGEAGMPAPPKLGTKPGFVKIVSFWSGKLSSKGGEINYSVKVPDFNGRLRVMVVAADGKRFSSASKDVVVKEDVVVQATFPRFLSWEDRFHFPITLINTTETPKNVSLSLNCEGLNLEPFPSLITLKPGQTRVLWIGAEAKKESLAKVTIKAKWEGGEFQDSYSTEIKPNIPKVEWTGFKTLTLPGEIDITSLYDQWLGKEHITKILLSPFPGITALSHLDYIINYPYGCIEQTSTTTLALVKAKELLPAIAPEISRNELANMVNHGILRILSMQTYSGGFSFWPGLEEEYPWASAYATFVLQEAKNAGYYVPTPSLKGAYHYLMDNMKGGLDYYVLARSGINSGQVKNAILDAERKFKDRLNLLWIAAALKEAGMAEEARKVLARAEKLMLINGRRINQDFASPIKTTAVDLYVRQLVNGDIGADEINSLANIFQQESYYYTTQEIAWALVAIEHYLKKHPPSSQMDAYLEVDGSRVKLKKKGFLMATEIREGPYKNNLILKIRGSGNAFLTLQMKGFRKGITSFQPQSEHLEITRRILQPGGGPVNSAKLGELLLMEVVVRGDGYYENAAIEVPLPAGLEVENPRLSGEIEGVESSFEPDYVDIRDDRVIIFGTISPRPQTYYILVRAVTPGLFFLPPSTASLMYAPGYYARTSADVFKVEKK